MLGSVHGFFAWYGWSALVAIGTLALAAMTAALAFSAWRTAQTAVTEAHARTEPYLVMAVPRQDCARDALVIPLKNLGLGPARVVVLQIKDLADDHVVSARIDPGLASMESSEHVMFALFWPKLDPPTWWEVSIEGSCEDSTGKRHPIYIFGGGQPLPFPASDVKEIGSERLLDDAALTSRAFHLKQVGRATRDGAPVDAAKEWHAFWVISARQGHEGPEFVEWARGEWTKLGLPEGQFLPPEWVDAALRSVEGGGPRPHE